MIKKRKSLLPILLILILILTYYISTYWFQITLIQGESMSPTLAPNSLAIANKHTKSFHDGDIIVFYAPNVQSTCIKRIIACPNESVEIENGLIYVNNTLSPFQLPSTYISYSGIAFEKILLSENQYFVIGDNYEYSIDSRYPEIGIVSHENITGKIIFPNTRVK